MESKTKLDPRKVWSAIQAVPSGETASYGQIAMRAGYPGRARWVASLLSGQQGPPRLPWHRIVRSDGRIAFPLDSKEYLEQSRRLRAEGVLIKNGKVVTAPRRNLDEALWR